MTKDKNDKPRMIIRKTEGTEVELDEKDLEDLPDDCEQEEEPAEVVRAGGGVKNRKDHRGNVR